jgi:RNA polymerase sigma-B factor
MLTTTARSTEVAAIDVADADLFRALPGATPDETQRIHALLVSRHAGLVRWIASRYAGRGVEIDELRQVAYVGLMLAIRRFDPDRGLPFVAFARPTVQGEIQRHFRDRRRWIRLPRRLQELKAALAVAQEELVHALGRWPSKAELAAFLLIEEDQVREALAAEDTFELASVAEPVAGYAELSLADVLGAPDPHLDLVVDRQVLRALLTELPPRDQQILQLRFFADQTQSQIGHQLGLSQMHVSRLLSSTLDTLREQMEAAD